MHLSFSNLESAKPRGILFCPLLEMTVFWHFALLSNFPPLPQLVKIRVWARISEEKRVSFTNQRAASITKMACRLKRLRGVMEQEDYLMPEGFYYSDASF
jgi:hypothetical protein